MDGGRGEGQEEEKSATRLHWQRNRNIGASRNADSVNAARYVTQGKTG
jgi:hypothetical protein